MGKWRQFGGDVRGGIALMFGLSLPVVAVAGLGGMEVVSVVSDRHHMQTIAEAAALAGAKQLNVDNSSATAERATQFANAELTSIQPPWKLQVTSEIVDDGHGVKVSISGVRGSFFGNLLPPGGWKSDVSATADIAGQTPLCILGFDTAGSPVISLQNNAVISAPGCGIQSDNDVVVSGAASIQAAAVSAVGAASGAIVPSPLTGAPTISDPFAAMSIAVPGGCADTDLKVGTGTVTLSAGVHCGTIKLQHGAVLQLAPGEHYFSGGELTLLQDSQMMGTDVVLIFDDTEKVAFRQNSEVTLEGRKSGPYAGFVLAATRANSSDFEISTDHAHELLGTVYIPNGTLTVSGTNNAVADQSAWTVIVAKQVHLAGSPNLVVNSNYTGSTIPVPSGVGPSRVKLTK